MHFNPEIAKLIGVDEAIMLENIIIGLSEIWLTARTLSTAKRGRTTA
jgi:hypothetical protein